jgi:hypothetical protein
MIGKGPDKKGAVWVAVRIPDGYVSGHAKQARITTFPLNDPETASTQKTLYHLHGRWDISRVKIPNLILQMLKIRFIWRNKIL